MINFKITLEFVSGSGMESKYLKFLDLGLKSSIFKNVDDRTLEVELPTALQMEGNTFHTLYIGFSCCGIIFSVFLDLDKL